MSVLSPQWRWAGRMEPRLRIPGGWNSKCEGPEEGTGWVSFKTRRKAAMTGAQGAWGKVAWWCLSRRWDQRVAGNASPGKASRLLSKCVGARERFQAEK